MISMPIFAALIILGELRIIAWGEIMTNSLWKETASMPTFPAQQGSARTDVLIIGGGIAGILCAHMLSQAGMEYILVEEQEICSGITENTTAKITAQHGLIYHRLLRTFLHGNIQHSTEVFCSLLSHKQQFSAIFLTLFLSSILFNPITSFKAFLFSLPQTGRHPVPHKFILLPYYNIFL